MPVMGIASHLLDLDVNLDSRDDSHNHFHAASGRLPSLLYAFIAAAFLLFRYWQHCTVESIAKAFDLPIHVDE